MPVDRMSRLSISQFSDLLGIEPSRLVAVEVNRKSSTVTLVLEPVEPAEYAPGLGERYAQAVTITGPADHFVHVASPDATGHP